MNIIKEEAETDQEETIKGEKKSKEQLVRKQNYIMHLLKLLDKPGSEQAYPTSSFLMLYNSNTERLQNPNVLKRGYIGLVIL